MKNFISVFTLFAFTLSLACCKKTETGPASGSVTFKVDSTTDFTSSFAGGNWESGNSLLNITAKGGKSIIVINVAMPNGIKTGTYNFSAASGGAGTATFYRPDTAIVNEGYYSSIDAKSFGTLIVTGVTSDSVLTGTFTFTLKDPNSGKLKVITTGAINSVKVIDNKKNTTTNGSTFTAKIDGTLWTSTLTAGTVSSGKLNISASDGVKSMGITVPSNVTAGSYTMDFFTGTYIGVYNPTFSLTNPQSFIASTATSKLTITANNATTKTITGTFNFKGEDFSQQSTKVYLITEGTFNVKY